MILIRNIEIVDMTNYVDFNNRTLIRCYVSDRYLFMYKEKLKTHKTYYLNNHIKKWRILYNKKERNIYFKTNLLKDQRTINATLQRPVSTHRRHSI